MTITAFVFPGQGSQTVGMLSHLAEDYPSIKKDVNSVSDRLGYDLWALIEQGPEERLNQTEYTQVAMLTADVVLFRLLEREGLNHSRYMAGHSLGEYAALVCASSLSLPDAAALVAKRGQLMQKAVPLGWGAMAAVIGLDGLQVDELCKNASTTKEQVTSANYNAIGQIVIAGHTAAVERAIEAAMEQEGARMAKKIPVSVPCHCPLLSSIQEEFADYLHNVEFTRPKLPVISNVTCSPYKTVEEIRALLKEQLVKPVRWVETIQYFVANKVSHVVECGPGKVLSGLIKRIDKQLYVISASTSLSELRSLYDQA